MKIAYPVFFGDFIFTGIVGGDERGVWRDEWREQGAMAGRRDGNQMDHAATTLIGGFGMPGASPGRLPQIRSGNICEYFSFTMINLNNPSAPNTWRY